jgi:hypothetical protein
MTPHREHPPRTHHHRHHPDRQLPQAPRPHRPMDRHRHRTGPPPTPPTPIAPHGHTPNTSGPAPQTNTSRPGPPLTPPEYQAFPPFDAPLPQSYLWLRTSVLTHQLCRSMWRAWRASDRRSWSTGTSGSVGGSPLSRSPESSRCVPASPIRGGLHAHVASLAWAAVTERRRPGCCCRDEWPWRVRRPSAPAFADHPAQSEGPCNHGIVARASGRPRRRPRGPTPSCRKDR